MYLCAIKDVFSNRIAGYSISDRMSAQPAVDALNNAVAPRLAADEPVAAVSCILTAGPNSAADSSSLH